MAKLRPDADAAIGSWTDDGGGTTNIYQSIDEVTASDVDFIQSEANPVSSAYRATLSNPAGIVDTNKAAVINYRYAKEGSAQVDLTVELIEGASTVRATRTITDIPATETDGTITLTSGEKTSVTDWNNVSLRFTANTTGLLPTDAVLLEDGTQLTTDRGEDLVLAKAVNLTSTYNAVPDPDEIDYVLSASVAAGTLYWVVTATATKPTLGTSGFDTSGLLNGSVYITGTSGNAVADLTSLGAGTYYLHSVVQRTSDRYYTSRTTDEITIV